NRTERCTPTAPCDRRPPTRATSCPGLPRLRRTGGAERGDDVLPGVVERPNMPRVSGGLERVRLGVVGAGNIAPLNVAGYLEHDRCDVVAVCDPAEDYARAA